MQSHLVMPHPPAAHSSSVGLLFPVTSGMDADAEPHIAAAEAPQEAGSLCRDDDEACTLQDTAGMIPPDLEAENADWPFGPLPLVRSPFSLLVDPQPAQAAARHAATLPLPKRAVYLFTRKGAGANLDDAGTDEDDEEI